MKIKDVVDEMYSEPQEFVDPGAIARLNKEYTPVVNWLIDSGENHRGLFNIDLFDINKDWTNAPSHGQLDPKKSSKSWTNDIARKLDGKTGIYAWWDPAWGYFNIGTTSDPKNHTFLDRTRTHLSNLTKHPEEHLEKSWIPMITLKNGDKIKPGVRELNRFLAAKLENMKIVFWEIPKPENISVKQFDSALKTIEQDLTEKHRPITNKATNIAGRGIDSIIALKQVISQDPNSQKIVGLLKKLKDELRYMQSHIDITKNSKLQKMFKPITDNYYKQLSAQLDNDNVNVGVVELILDNIENVLNLYYKAKVTADSNRWSGKKDSADSIFAQIE